MALYAIEQRRLSSLARGSFVPTSSGQPTLSTKTFADLAAEILVTRGCPARVAKDKVARSLSQASFKALNI